MKGLIIYSREEDKLTEKNDYSVIRLLSAAKEKNIDLSLITPNQFELVVTRNDKKSVLIDDKPTAIPDFVMPRLGSDTGYYALAVIRQLEHLGVYVCNGADSITAVKDKLHMHQLLAYSNLPTPRTMLVKFPVTLEVVRREIGFPLVIKNVTGTQGSGIYLCESESKFIDVMELIYSNNEKANIILQEFVEKSRGTDLRAFVLGGRVIGCMRRSSETSFKANFSKGGSVEPFELTPEIEWLATETARLANLDIAGIDLLFDQDSYKICEANSAPGFKGMEQAIGRHIAEDILDYLILKTGINYN
ncbi:RimK family alpha-L-glutamate ligase [Thiotrichales bacterium 19S11-10]|nr:RimK family alpha-L-glutamate ligase [Thiotrichales bacterium 19S11-10]MCF6808474.1 RimK family alpha-L-glutamate ligase [Thiotrichales bacterium 19S9-11]MCF6812444.1 RimK family alpha-L-glutamate ligase [Thiotrichales bacterium 19S9-12]